jgi:AraC-like DNA-binding protein
MPVLKQVRNNSPLGKWCFTLWAPSSALRGYVMALWDLESEDAYTRERIPPRTHFDLLINLGEPHRLWRGAALQPVEYRRAWIAGLQQEFLDIESPRASRLLGAQLTPLGAGGLLGFSPLVIGGQVVELEEILGPEVERLRERLGEQKAAEMRLPLFEEWLAARLSHRPAQHFLASQAVAEIARSHGMRRIGDIARGAGVSHKHLITLFEESIGVTPKLYSQVVRFNGVLDHLKQHAGADWGDIVYRFGYFDQTHFAREMRRFTGASPTEFLRSLGPEGDTVVVPG